MRRLPKKRLFRWQLLFKLSPHLRECRNRSENLINRKNTKFYIEAVPQNFFQLRQKIFFRDWSSKKSRFENFGPVIKGIFKTQAFSKSLCFEHSLYNRAKIFKSWFFGTSTSKKCFLSKLKKVLGHSFDVEFCVLSIYEVFRAIPALSQAADKFE